MIFSEKQIKQCLDIIDFQILFYCSYNVSPNTLSESDMIVLKNHGVDVNSIKTKFTPFQQAFYFGILAAILEDQSKNVSYNDFLKYLRRGQFIPLTKVQMEMLEYLENKTYDYIRGIGQDIKSKFKSHILTSPLLKETMKEGVIKNKSVKEIVSDIGHRIDNWSYDLGRIVETECQNTFQQGMLTQYRERYGDSVLYYKEVYPGACKHCIRLYLMDGIDSQPRLFTYKELVDNGSNIGKNQNEWKATIESIHPFCRCHLFKVFKDMVWDKEIKTFIVPKKDKSKINKETNKIFENGDKYKGLIKIKVGDKIFKV